MPPIENAIETPISPRRRGRSLIGALLAILFVLLQCLMVVRTDEQVLVSTLGRPDRLPRSPGLRLKWPWPIQRIHRMDARIQTFEGAYEQTSTGDQRVVLAAVYAGWRIADPFRFLSLESQAQAETHLDSLIRSHKDAIIGQYPFSALVNVDPDAVRIEHIEREILGAVQGPALELYGIEIQLLGFRKLGLPPSVTDAVYRRMRQERESAAVGRREDGLRRAAEIRADADRERSAILAHAEAEALRIRADGEAAAAEHYAVFKAHPEMAIFFRKLEALEMIIDRNTTLILDADTPPFDLLRADAGQSTTSSSTVTPTP